MIQQQKGQEFMRRRNAPAVSFCGYYGMDNYGDDLFGIVCAWGASLFWQTENIQIVGPSLPTHGGSCVVPAWFPKAVYSARTFCGAGSRCLFAARAALGTDLWVFGGGSILHSARSAMRDMVSLVARCRRLQLAAIGVSIGPFENARSEHVIRELLCRFAYLSVRDDWSYEWATSQGFNYPLVRAPDLAALIPEACHMPALELSPPMVRIGVAIGRMHDTDGRTTNNNPPFHRAVRSVVLEAAQQRQAFVEILSLANHRATGDDPYAEDLSLALGASGIPHRVTRNADVGAVEVWRRISQSTVLLTTRLHGAMSGFMCDVPVCLLEHHKKCTSFLDEIGQPHSVRITKEDCSDERVAHVLSELLENPPRPAVSSSRFRDDARKHFTMAPWTRTTAGAA